MADVPNFDKAALAWTLPWDADWVTAVTFVGNNRVVAGNNVGHILLWDLPEKTGGEAPKPTRRLDAHSNVVSHLLTAADGKTVISASYDHTIRYWDIDSKATGAETVALNARTIEDLKRRSASKLPALNQAKVELHKPARTLEGHKEWVTAMQQSHDGTLLISGDDGGNVIIWDRVAGKELRRWSAKGWVQALALSPDNKQAVVTERVPLVFDQGRHAGVKLWDAATGKMQREISADYKGMHMQAAAYSADGKLLAIGRGGEADGQNGKVFIVDPTSGKKLRELAPGHLNGLTDLKFLPDGKLLASCGRDTVVRIWNPEDGKLIKEIGKPRGGQFKDWITSIAFSPDSRWLAAADQAGAVQIWSLV